MYPPNALALPLPLQHQYWSVSSLTAPHLAAFSGETSPDADLLNVIDVRFRHHLAVSLSSAGGNLLDEGDFLTLLI